MVNFYILLQFCQYISEIRGQESEVRDQKSEVGIQETVCSRKRKGKRAEGEALLNV